MPALDDMISVMNNINRDDIVERARRLKEARKRLFPSTQAAADALGINPTTLRAHENGQNGYPVSAAQRYAEAYDVTLEWMLTGDTTAAPATTGHRPKPPISMTSLPGGKARLEMNITLPFATAIQVLALVQGGQEP